MHSGISLCFVGATLVVACGGVVIDRKGGQDAGTATGGAAAAGAGGATPTSGAGGATGMLPSCGDGGAANPSTGFLPCPGGSVHRAAKRDCPSSLPRRDAAGSYASCSSGVICDSDSGAYCAQFNLCYDDSECTAQPNGYCNAQPGLGPDGFPACGCSYGCIGDGDCGPGEICLCGDPVGQCVPADCTVDAECGTGLCLSDTTNYSCTEPPPPLPDTPGFACQVPVYACARDANCADEVCAQVNGGRACKLIPCPSR